jgi:hypothetical protein
MTVVIRQKPHPGITTEKQGSTFHFGNDVPNFPEVSGTSFPVLATVLAGFAVTIAVQLILRPDGADALPGRIVLAIGAFLLSTLALLFSTVFAINAQARNYLPFLDLSDAGRDLMNVGDLTEWVIGIERQWYIYHWATLFAFYSGTILLLTGINLIVWVFIGAALAVMFLVAILASIGVAFAVAMYVERADAITWEKRE